MTVWHWVRHGPTHAKNFVGWRNLSADLSDTARISRLRTHLPENGLLIASDLARAKSTADSLQKPQYTRLPDDPHLREIHFGVWDGMHFTDIADRDPVLSRQFWERPGEITAPSGESWDDAKARVNGCVQRLNHRFPDAHIVAAAHFGVILTQVQQASGMTAYEALGHKIDNFSVTRITWEGDTGQVDVINQIP